MLLLLFRIGNDSYAIDAGVVSEVLPVVELKGIPHAPAGVVGLFDLRGAPIPVIDLSLLMSGQPAARRLSTRLIVVRYADGVGTGRLLGLIAERVTETLRRTEAEFVSSGIAQADTAYLGPVTAHRGVLVQRLDVNKLLPPAIRAALCPAPEACA